MKKFIAIIAAAVLAVTLTGCNGGQTKSQQEGQKETEQAFSQQSKTVPYPATELRDSVERRQIRERLLRFNQPGRIGYVYYTPFGTRDPLGYWVIKGKITSTQSQMTTEDLISKPCGSCDRYVIPGPGDDGSYGPNEPGVFFFTTSGAMIQVCESCYFYSDQPIALGGVDIPEIKTTPKS